MRLFWIFVCSALSLWALPAEEGPHSPEAVIQAYYDASSQNRINEFDRYLTEGYYRHALDIMTRGIVLSRSVPAAQKQMLKSIPEAELLKRAYAIRTILENLKIVRKTMDRHCTPVSQTPMGENAMKVEYLDVGGAERITRIAYLVRDESGWQIERIINKPIR